MSDLPRWTARVNASRPTTEFDDLLAIVSHHFQVFAQAEAFIGPYNARQRNSKIYMPPSKEQLKEVIKRGRMNEFSYMALINGLVRFCETTKGSRALPAPHPSTVHSIQVPYPAFELKIAEGGHKIGSHMLTIPGAEPLYLDGVRADAKFVIVRPKLSKLGTPSAVNWEVLLFNTNYGYIPHWTDSNLNPRWAGVL